MTDLELKFMSGRPRMETTSEMRKLTRVRYDTAYQGLPVRPTEAHVVDLLNLILSTRGVNEDALRSSQPQVIHSCIGPNSYGRLGDWLFLQVGQKGPEEQDGVLYAELVD